MKVENAELLNDTGNWKLETEKNKFMSHTDFFKVLRFVMSY